jgi:hypothetical protein
VTIVEEGSESNGDTEELNSEASVGQSGDGEGDEAATSKSPDSADGEPSPLKGSKKGRKGKAGPLQQPLSELENGSTSTESPEEVDSLPGDAKDQEGKGGSGQDSRKGQGSGEDHDEREDYDNDLDEEEGGYEEVQVRLLASEQ